MKILFGFLALFLFCFSGRAQTIATIAGGGPVNLQGLSTGLAQPTGLAVDSLGNVYVSLAQINQIWKITPNAQVNLFAGNGSFPYNGDGIQAVAATLYQPQGLAFDSSGNLYVADSGHNRIRRISTTGVISTVAGTGSASFGGDGALGTAAQLNNPVAVAVDAAGNVYIADKNNHRIRRVLAGGTIETFAGTGTASFSGDSGLAASAGISSPTGVAVDSANTVYIADSLNFRVRKVVAGTISTVAGTGTFGYTGDGGAAASARLNTITGVTVDPFRNLYIVEGFDVRLVPGGTGNISTVLGNSTPGYAGDGSSPTVANFRNLASMAFDSTGAIVYVSDAGNYRIRKALAGTVATLAGNGSLDFTGNGLAAVSANFLTPNSLALDGGNSLVFADVGSSSIRRLDALTGIVSNVAGSGFLGFTADGGAASEALTNPFAIVYDPRGAYYFVEGNRIRRLRNGVYSTVGNTANVSGYSGDGGAAAAAQFKNPSGLALATNGDLYVADSQNHRVRVINAQTGVVSTIAGTGTAGFSGDGGLATNAMLNGPSALSLDGNGNLFVADLLGNRVRKIALSANLITTAAGDGTTNYADGVPAAATGLSAPLGIFADQSSNLFIADQGHSRVRKVTAGTNLISTVAGNGTYDFSGDGGFATVAAVNPLGVIVDRARNLYIADSSGRVRRTVVNACFFTLGTPVIYANHLATAGSVSIVATDPSCPYTLTSSSPFVTFTGGASGTGSGTITFSISQNAGPNRTATVSLAGQSFSVVQAGVRGPYNVGFFQSTNGPIWVLDANGNGLHDPEAGDKYFTFAGQAGVIAVVGDWNGDGRSKVGYYANGFWVLDYNGNGVYDGVGPGGDKVYGYGGTEPGIVPVVGDWNGDGRTKVGYYKSGFWVLDLNGNGSYETGDAVYGYGGNAGELPVLGDWNGDGRTKIGVFVNGTWILDYNGDGSYGASDKLYTNYAFLPGDKPVVGDWNGDGKTKIGVFRGGFWALDYNGNGTFDGVSVDKFYAYGGNEGEIPIVADWNGDGRTKIGLYRNGFWTLDYNGNGTYEGTDKFIGYGGTPGNQLLVGRW